MPQSHHHHSSSQFPLHSSHLDSSSRPIRPPSHTNRRPSGLSSSDHRHRSAYQTPTSSDRARHWQTILGRQPGSSEHSHHNHSSSSSASTTHHPYPSHSSRSKSSSASPSSRRRLNVPASNHDSSRSVRTPPPKPFACQQCERRFERIGHLRSHVDAVHNLRQPYVCHYNGCGKTFSHRSSLCRHVKGVHEKHRHHDKTSRTNRQVPPGTGPFGFHGFIGTRS